MSSSHEPQTRKLSDLRENPTSTEIYGADDISDLLESIPREGVLEPLVIKPDGTILSGHRRFRAAKQLVGEGRVESDVVPCRVVDVRDETGEKGLIIQFNRQRKKTFEQMMKEAQVLEAVEKTKAEERQQSGLLLGEQRKLPSASGEANGPRQGKAAEALAGEIGVSRATYERGKKVWDAAKHGDPTAQQLVGKLNRGEVTVSDAYQRVRSEEKQREKRAEMDRVRAAPILPSEGTLLGDCREEMKKLGDGSVALILTDVPFFITAEMAVHRLVNPMKFDPGLAQAQEELREFDVFGSQEEYFALMREWMTEAVRVLKPGGHLVSFVDRLKITEFAKIGESLGLAVRQPIYWLVSNPVPNADKRDFMSAVMSMIWFTKPGEGGGGRPTFNYQLGQHPNYFSAPYVSGAEKGRHPSQKPVSILKEIISYLTDPGDVVLDPFMGSGSTLEAARELKRKAIGIEKDEYHYKTARERLQAWDESRGA
jgi:DNA modification methylase